MSEQPSGVKITRRVTEKPLGASDYMNLYGLIDAVVERMADRFAARLVTQPASPATQSPGKLAVSIAEAAELIGVSPDHFRRHVLPDLRIVRSGRLRLIAVAELERWLDRSAARVLAGARLAHDETRPHSRAVSESAQGSRPRAPKRAKAA